MRLIITFLIVLLGINLFLCVEIKNKFKELEKGFRYEEALTVPPSELPENLDIVLDVKEIKSF